MPPLTNRLRAYPIRQVVQPLGSIALFQHEQHGHHHHCHMVMPAFPFSGLVFTHSAVVLGFLEISFDPVPLGLHVRQSFMRCRCIGVAQAVCKISIRIASYDQMPAMGSGLFPIPKPNPSMENLNPQLSLGGVADERFFPTRRRLLFDPLINPDRFALGFWL